MRACTGDNPDAVRPAFRGHFPVAISPVSDTLAPRHPNPARQMNEEPFAPWVTVHCIIGDRGRGGPLAKEQRWRGAYTSSHSRRGGFRTCRAHRSRSL